MQLTQVVLLCAALSACGREQTELPLFDWLHQPRVSTESADVVLPSGIEPNRFVQGWWDSATHGRPRLAPRGLARIQGVQLETRPRRLILSAVVSPREGGFIDVRVAHGEWHRYPLAAKTRVPIPPTTPVGRFSVDIRLPEGNRMQVKQARFSDAVSPGSGLLKDGHLVQSGYSMVELVRRLDGETHLAGGFRPPSGAVPGQRFSLEIEEASGRRNQVFRWEQASGAAREETFELVIGGKDDFVGLRFVAQGEGPPAQWRNLRIRSRAPQRIGMQEPPRPPKLVILYVMDALRADHLGHLGGPKEISPTIDRLAEQGASFRNHFSVAPNTVPSMKSLFTGQKFLLKGGYKLSPTSGPTLAERFSAAGYRTGLFSGNGNVSSWRGLTRGFEFTAQRVLWTGSSSRHDVGYNNNAEQVHNATLEWLDTLGEGHKAFVHIQTIHPHNPYDPPEPFLTRFVPKNESTVDGRTDTLKSIRTQRLEVSEADKERLKGLYAAGVAYNDAHIGKFIEAILERYEENEILLVITSDHGEELFEHGGILHGYTLYEEMLHIPLVVWWPGRVARREIVAATDNVDLHATLAALADFGGSTSTERDDANAGGISLWGYLTGTLKPDRAQKDVIFAAASAVRGGIFMARSERYKWILAPRRGSRGGGRWGMGQGLGRGYDAEYLFDLVRDPEETTNLAGATALEGDWLRARLDAWIEAGIRLESGESLGEMDEETRKSLRALGYLQ